MEFVKIDDARLDENYSFFFTYNKGDYVKSRNDRGLKGEITDGYM